MLADAINVPFVLGFGLAVLIPLLAFEVLVEAWLLRLVWRLSFRQLCGLALIANLWSLLAGIPTKIFNSSLGTCFMPGDIPGFFARYPLAAALGAGVYFLVTLIVEWICARRWLRKHNLVVRSGTVALGIIVANVATYSVLAPLHYHATRPVHELKEIRNHIRWSKHPETMILFVDSVTKHVKSAQLNGAEPETVVPFPARDYIVSADLSLCLFRSPSGDLSLFKKATGQTKIVWKTKERFRMKQVAFSPSGRYVAFVNQASNRVEVVDSHTDNRLSTALPFKAWDYWLAWSRDESMFLVRGNGTISSMRVSPDAGALAAESAPQIDPMELLPVYGRFGDEMWSGTDDWGVTFREDACGDLKAWCEPGLASGLVVYRGVDYSNRVLTLRANPGLLHLPQFQFRDVAFLPNCGECFFEANGYLYLLDIPGKRLGTISRGDRPVLMTSRYIKRL